jgi:bifunctional enzyme CysN/CysC
MELLRFLTCGGVDHGKSTMIGRLLFDSRSVPDDLAQTARRDTARYGGDGTDLDFAMLVDGLRAEREQGITIDVAHRFFTTAKRQFIIADAPGHEEYTRNMATAASNCDLAVVLVDALEGVVEQTRRHSFIASLLGVRHLVLAVNKMDLVDWDERRFDEICRTFGDFCARLEVTDIEFIPMSAANGDNVVVRGASAPWYRGRPLLDYLENVHVAGDRNLIDLRFPVQIVLRPAGGARSLAGTIASGVLRAGEEVAILPSRNRARIASLESAGAAVGEAVASMAITATLDRDVDVSRGDMLAHVRNVPAVGTELEAMMVWMGEEPLKAGHEYLMKQTAVQTSCVVSDVRYRVDVHELHRHAAESLSRNEIGRVRIETGRPIAFDDYGRNRVTGAFILIDRMTNDTVGAGMIVDREAASQIVAEGEASSVVIEGDRATLAAEVDRLLFDAGNAAVTVERISENAIRISVRRTGESD